MKQMYLMLPPLLCPSGLDPPADSDFVRRLKELNESGQEDSIALIPTTQEELESMLKLCCYTPPNLPRQVQDCVSRSGRSRKLGGDKRFYQGRSLSRAVLSVTVPRRILTKNNYLAANNIKK